jgi:hypothetical protein
VIPQLLCHLWGDYLLQSDWMAQNKTKRFWPAYTHSIIYTLPFLFLTQHFWALFVIEGTHYFIDRYRLARYAVWAKNWMGSWVKPVDLHLAGTDVTDRHWHYKQPTPDFAECAATGYPPTTPIWLSTWLLIIADNTFHLTINYLAIKYL